MARRRHRSRIAGLLLPWPAPAESARTRHPDRTGRDARRTGRHGGWFRVSHALSAATLAQDGASKAVGRRPRLRFHAFGGRCARRRHPDRLRRPASPARAARSRRGAGCRAAPVRPASRPSLAEHDRTGRRPTSGPRPGSSARRPRSFDRGRRAGEGRGRGGPVSTRPRVSIGLRGVAARLPGTDQAHASAPAPGRGRTPGHGAATAASPTRATSAAGSVAPTVFRRPLIEPDARAFQTGEAPSARTLSPLANSLQLRMSSSFIGMASQERFHLIRYCSSAPTGASLLSRWADRLERVIICLSRTTSTAAAEIERG